MLAWCCRWRAAMLDLCGRLGFKGRCFLTCLCAAACEVAGVSGTSAVEDEAQFLLLSLRLRKAGDCRHNAWLDRLCSKLARRAQRRIPRPGPDNHGVVLLAVALQDSRAISTMMTTLDLCQTGVGDVGAAALAQALSACCSLTALLLGSNEICDAGAEALAAALPGSRVTRLNLAWNPIGDAGAEALAAVLANTVLQMVDLCYCNSISTLGLEYLGQAVPLTTVTDMFVGGRRATDRGNPAKRALEARIHRECHKNAVRTLLHQVLAELPHLAEQRPWLATYDNGELRRALETLQKSISGLQHIAIHMYSSLPWEPSDLRTIATLLPFYPSVWCLNLSRCRMRQGCLDALADEPLSPHLRSLDLTEAEVGDRGFAALARMLSRVDCSLESLTLRKASVGDEGAAFLAAALRASKLTTLILSQNNIGDEGALALARALKDTSLTRLELAQNRIGDPGAAALLTGLTGTKITCCLTEDNGFSEYFRKALWGAQRDNERAQWQYPVIQLSLDNVDEHQCEVKGRTLGGNVVVTYLADRTLDSEQLYMNLRSHFPPKVWPKYVLPNGSLLDRNLPMSLAELFP